MRNSLRATPAPRACGAIVRLQQARTALSGPWDAAIRQATKGTWIDRNTRGVWFEFTVYTPDVDILSIVQLTTIFTPTGDLIPEFDFYHVSRALLMSV